ncbi:MAG: hypothetical protein K0R57_3090 [Paenibacillaceae bacterium]|jgi:sensor histidine kinase YesM|nr:hypothetical protein [Paenibacillaceae bacterium]
MQVRTRGAGNKNLEQSVKKNMVLISGIPLVLAVLFIFIYVSYNTVHDFRRSLADSAGKCAQLINSELDMFLTKSSVILQNRYLIKGLQQDYQGDIEKMMGFYENLEILISEPFGDKYRGFFTVYPYNEGIYEGSYVERLERIKDLGVEERLSALENTDILWWDQIHTRTYRDNAAYVQFYRSIKDFDQPLGVLEANIPFEALKRVMDNTAIPQEAVLVFTDAAGGIRHIRNDGSSAGGAAEDFVKSRYMNVTVQLINSQSITAAIPYSLITARLVRLFAIMAAVLTMVFLVTYYISKYSARNAMHRLKSFIEVLRKDESLLLHQERIPEPEDGEVAVIQRKFKELISRIYDLHREASQARVERSRFELELLQSRINPHLLYNSLSVIKWNAQWNKDSRTAELIDHMTGYYRAALSKGNSIIKISEELNMVKDYVRINEFSYNSSYEMVIDMEQAVLECYTFKHLLQPIVENSILHGLNGREDGGVITIGGRREGENIRITVTDNGAGMSGEKLAQLMNGEASQASGGYGMKNLLKRIHMYFGEQYGMDISSTPGEGTCITLFIQALEQKQLPDELGNK